MRFSRLFAPVFVGVMLISPPIGSAFALDPVPPPAGALPPNMVPVAPAPALDPAQTPAVPAKKKAAAPVVHERVVPKNDKRPTFHPDSLGMINEAAQRYQAIDAAGGWPILPKNAVLKLGEESDLVPALRRRLSAEGDLPPGADLDNPLFDPALAEAVKRFQARHGQSRNGLVTGPTLAALRVSARERFEALNASARRLTLHAFVFGPRHVVVNIPSAAVEAIENGTVEKRFIAVVGKKDRASPEVETRITNINFNPTWTVPFSIVKKDIIPKMQKDPTYLAKSKIRIFGASGNEVDPAAIDWNTERALAFTLRQDSGAANALGQLRIDMPNREAVYMHDTPTKRLFLRDDRFHSSGCVRVENVRDLAAWILEGSKGWDRAAIDAAIASGKRGDVRPREPIPVAWTYLTGYVTPDGAVHFRPDVYGLDAPAGAQAQAAPTATPAPPRVPAAPLGLDSAALNARVVEASRVPIQQIDP